MGLISCFADGVASGTRWLKFGLDSVGDSTVGWRKQAAVGIIEKPLANFGILRAGNNWRRQFNRR